MTILGLPAPLFLFYDFLLVMFLIGCMLMLGPPRGSIKIRRRLP